MIASALMPAIPWRPEVPAWLKDILRGLLSLISFDLSVLLSSPECAAEMPPLRRDWWRRDW